MTIKVSFTLDKEHGIGIWREVLLFSLDNGLDLFRIRYYNVSCVNKRLWEYKISNGIEGTTALTIDLDKKVSVNRRVGESEAGFLEGKLTKDSIEIISKIEPKEWGYNSCYLYHKKPPNLEYMDEKMSQGTKLLDLDVKNLNRYIKESPKITYVEYIVHEGWLRLFNIEPQYLRHIKDMVKKIGWNARVEQDKDDQDWYKFESEDG